MPHFLVKQSRGPVWDPARGRRQQDGWNEHAAFVDCLAEAGTLLLAGPLGEVDGLDVILVVLAPSEDHARALFVPDPWNETVLRTVSVEPWAVWVGAERLSTD
jgi:uncharacterized protein YciI